MYINIVQRKAYRKTKKKKKKNTKFRFIVIVFFILGNLNFNVPFSVCDKFFGL